MSFANAEYLPFLLLVALLFPFLPERRRALGMLLASYAFYLGQPLLHFAVLLASTLLDFVVGIALERTRRTALRRALLAISLGTNFGALVAFKYLPVLGSSTHWYLALGISFYTFQTVAYTIDVYQGRIKACRNLVDFALFVTFFPQLIAGPIERANHLMPQLRNLQPVNLPNLSLGSRLILWGLFKKVCLADRFGAHGLQVLAAPEGKDTLTLLLSSYTMLAVLYLDFSAYTDIARGTARLFGVDLVQNFRAPFAATSIGDFTRRWHMSLIHWIEQYLFVPLMRGRPTHLKIWRTNTLLIALFGLWHGPYVAYFVGGAALGVAISIEQSLRLRQQRRGRARARKTWPMALLGWGTAVTLWSAFVVVLYSKSSESVAGFYRAFASAGWPDAGALPAIARITGLLLIGLGIHIAAYRLDLERLWHGTPRALRAAAFIAICILVLTQSDSQREPFVYFRF